MEVFIYLSCLLNSLHREVFKAKHRQTGKKVALKKVLMENEKEGVRGHSESTVLVYRMFHMLIGTLVLLCEHLSMCAELGNWCYMTRRKKGMVYFPIC